MADIGNNMQRASRSVPPSSARPRARTSAVPREPRQCALDTWFIPKRLISRAPSIGTHAAMRTPGRSFAHESRATPL